MREFRSRSQILFGFLPEQTVDLRGRVWKVARWPDSIRRFIDDEPLRYALKGQAAKWAAENNDGGFVDDLHRGREIEVRSLNMDAGVIVEPFPNVWVCKKCQRTSTSSEHPCACGSVRWGQFHFVGYHDCGAVRAPYLPKCPEHRQSKVVFPGTASAAEIRIVCPVCNKQLRKGLGMPNCECGNGRLQYTVHRAASVYTPRTVVVVNPPTKEQVQDLVRAGGAARALSWLVQGATTRSYADVPLTRSGLVDQLKAQGFTDSLAETMADQAVAAGEVSEPSVGTIRLTPDRRQEAERQAAVVAMALAESRIQVKDLIDRTESSHPLHSTYSVDYMNSQVGARMHSVELLDRLPVLTGSYGYTRGDATPGRTRLVPFRSPAGNYIVYADIAETEAFFVRLQPKAVAGWLVARGFGLSEYTTDEEARLAILEAAVIPNPGEEVAETAGDQLLTLVHSYAHRFLREAALFAGIERHGLSELLVPLHVGFFVYAAARGDFVLGGLQAVFENDLDRLLASVVENEHRCPLDPGCAKSGGA